MGAERTTLRIATRASPLARWQAEHVAALLGTGPKPPVVELVLVETEPDRRLDVPMWALGGKGLFVKEVQAAVLDGRADVAVHSAKDLPARTPAALDLVAVPERGDPRDGLVGGRLDELRTGAVVATGSVRRRAQLADQRPDLTFRGLRGNMATRLGALDGGDVDAIVVAVAGLERLGWGQRVDHVLDPDVLLPQVGQGALAVECRVPGPASTAAGGDPADDEACRRRLAALDHPPSRRAVTAERAFLAELGGDCDLPAGCHATSVADGALRVEGLLAGLDGHTVLRHVVVGSDAAELGAAVARHLLDHGGRLLLDR